MEAFNAINSPEATRHIHPMTLTCDNCGHAALYGSRYCAECRVHDDILTHRMLAAQGKARKPEDSTFHNLPLPRTHMGTVPMPAEPVIEIRKTNVLATVVVWGTLAASFIGGILFAAMR